MGTADDRQKVLYPPFLPLASDEDLAPRLTRQILGCLIEERGIKSLRLVRTDDDNINRLN